MYSYLNTNLELLYYCYFVIVRVLEKYYVGDLISNELPTFPELG